MKAPTVATHEPPPLSDPGAVLACVSSTPQAVGAARRIGLRWRTSDNLATVIQVNLLLNHSRYRYALFLAYRSGYRSWSLVSGVTQYVPRSSPGFVCAHDGDVEMLRAYLNTGQASILDADELGWTVLHHAVDGGNYETVKFLLDIGAREHGKVPTAFSYDNQPIS